MLDRMWHVFSEHNKAATFYENKLPTKEPVNRIGMALVLSYFAVAGFVMLALALDAEGYFG